MQLTQQGLAMAEAELSSLETVPEKERGHHDTEQIRRFELQITVHSRKLERARMQLETIREKKAKLVARIEELFELWANEYDESTNTEENLTQQKIRLEIELAEKTVSPKAHAEA